MFVADRFKFVAQHFLWEGKDGVHKKRQESHCSPLKPWIATSGNVFLLSAPDTCCVQSDRFGLSFGCVFGAAGHHTLLIQETLGLFLRLLTALTTDKRPVLST